MNCLHVEATPKHARSACVLVSCLCWAIKHHTNILTAGPNSSWWRQCEKLFHTAPAEVSRALSTVNPCTPVSTLLHLTFPFTHLGPPLIGQTLYVCLSITLALNGIVWVMLFGCVKVSILRCLCVFLPPGFPLHAPQEEMVYVNVFLVRTNMWG